MPSKLIEVGAEHTTRISAEVSTTTNAAIARHADLVGQSLQLLLKTGIEAFCKQPVSAAKSKDRLLVSVPKSERCNVSVRLSIELATLFENTCKSRNTSKSTAIRQIINSMLDVYDDCKD